MVRSNDVMSRFDTWTDSFVEFVRAKGRVQPDRYKAYGYEAPGHVWEDVKLKWREIRIGVGFQPAGSSPAAQQELGLNDDKRLFPKKSEGENLRDK